MRFLVDEDLPRSTTTVLQKYGHEAIDVRDINLRGVEDSVIASYAQTEKLCLLTGDFDFADIRNYPPVQYSGIVVLTIPKNATATYILILLDAFLQQEQIVEQLMEKLVIVEVDRIRIRTG